MQLPLASNGPFAFPGIVAAGTAYNVVVDVQPLAATCTLLNGKGSFVENVDKIIRVTCE